MKAYIVNYLKTDRSRNVQTVVVKAKSSDEAIEKANEEVGGFYDVGEIDVMSLAEAKRKSLLSNPMKKKTRKKVVRRKRRVVRRNPAIPANMNNPKYVKVLKLAQMRARNFGEPFGVYAYEGMDGPTFIARKPGDWPERYGKLVTLITPKGKRGLRGNPMRSSFDKPTFGPMNTETRRVDTTTMAGMKEAERLQRAGWYQGPVTLFSTTYYRKRALPRSSMARQIRGNPGVRERVMQIIRQDGEDKTDGEVLDEIYDYLKSIRSSDPVVRQLMKLSGQYRSPGDEGEILDDVASTLRMLRENPRLDKYEQKALDFARKYPGWHGFNPRKHTANIVRKLEKKGLVKVSNISNQFRAI